MRDDPSVIALVARARAGDQLAWDEIVERYAALVWGTCRRFRLSDADAHDVGQNVWLRLVEHLPSLREPAALPGWLATTTRRECLRVQRGGWDRDRELLDSELDRAADEETTRVDEALLAAEREHLVREAFAQLPEQCRRLLTLLVRDPPMSYSEISALLDIPVGSIGPTRARYLAKLRENPLIMSLIDDQNSPVGR
jgi:RNA polymerase sigma factor (sigma-70 family)